MMLFSQDSPVQGLTERFLHGDPAEARRMITVTPTTDPEDQPGMSVRVELPKAATAQEAEAVGNVIIDYIARHQLFKAAKVQPPY